MKNAGANYIRKHMKKVKGYMTFADADVFRGILDWQASQTISGNAFEIGLFYGRSFFLIAESLQDNETAFGADIFTVTPTQESDFNANAKMVGVDLSKHKIFAHDTAKLAITDLKMAASPVRFFSIDGGHNLHHIETDGAIAHALLSEDGVIAFDDFCNPEWPEVTQGIFQFLEFHKGAYRVFLSTRKKAYVCKTSAYDKYFRWAETSPLLQKYSRIPTTLYDHKYHFVRESYSDQVKDKLAEMTKGKIRP